jgi:hypothetical protein
MVDGQKMAGKLSKSPDENAPGIPTLEASRDSVMVRPALNGARQLCARGGHAAAGAVSSGGQLSYASALARLATCDMLRGTARAAPASADVRCAGRVHHAARPGRDERVPVHVLQQAERVRPAVALGQRKQPRGAPPPRMLARAHIWFACNVLVVAPAHDVSRVTALLVIMPSMHARSLDNTPPHARSAVLVLTVSRTVWRCMHPCYRKLRAGPHRAARASRPTSSAASAWRSTCRRTRAT